MSGPSPEYPAVSSERLDALRTIDAARIRQRDETIATFKGQLAAELSKLARIRVMSEAGMAVAIVEHAAESKKTFIEIHEAATGK